MKQILTATELAKIEGVSVSYIARLCRQGRIKSRKIGSRIYMITDEKIFAKISKKYPNKYCSEL